MISRTRTTRAHCAANAVAALLALAAPSGAAYADEGVTGEVTDRAALRVCADPANLPFSNEKHEGFENKIAELLAEELGLPLQYTWYPQSVGFVLNTLAAGRCDLVIGVAATDSMMQTSNPYYRSVYTMVHRQDVDVGKAGLASPALAHLTIGVVPRTPPVTVLARHGLLDRVKAYALIVDTRYDAPAKRMISDIASGKIDIGLLWGPMAGYWAKQSKGPLAVEPLRSEPGGPQMDFLISMGMRHNEPDWKHRINDALAKRKTDIDAILSAYGVPLLDETGALIKPARAAAATATVPEPDGYRMTDLRAPAPATLKGAEVVDAAGLNALMRKRPVVLIDVFSSPADAERPPKEPVTSPVKRETLIGGVWLPNTGFGKLPEELERYFERALAALSGPDRAKALVFYGEPNCWMSWNAAKRAIDLGYRPVYWYPGGVTEWQAARGAVMEAKPWTGGGTQ